eukprot:COSAG02_NODE_2836_length_7923_cov_152.700153_5_plen_563_part_00
MEFQGQRGDPFTAWSVGKYAKRSATIHLNSKDVMRKGARHFRANIVTQDEDGIVFDDIGGVVRTEFATQAYEGVVDYADGPYEQNEALGNVTPFNGTGLFSNDAAFTNITQIAQSDTNVLLQGPDTFGLTTTEDDYVNAGAGTLDTANGTAAVATAMTTTQTALRTLNLRQEHRVTINGTTINRAELRSPEHNTTKTEDKGKYAVMLPLASFPTATRGEVDPLQRLRVFNDISAAATQTHTDFDELVRQGNTGWRLELFYSANYRTDDPGKNAVDNAGKTFRFIYTGTAHFSKQHVVVGDTTMVKVFLNKSPNLDLLFTAAEYANMRGNNVLGFGSQAANAATNPETLKQIFWNLRKMPSLTLNAKDTFPSGQSHGDYIVNIPNIIGYPEHKRCLVQLQSLSLFPHNEFAMTDLNHNTRAGVTQQACPVYVGVEVQGVGGSNMFSTTGGTLRDTQLVGTCCLDVKGHRFEHLGGHGVDVGHRVLSYGYDNCRSVLDDGVLINSPFGKSVRVRFLNLTTNETLNTNAADDLGDNRHTTSDIINNPTHLTLRLLFLDDDELPMR